MKKNTKKLITIAAAAFAGMYAYNKFVETNATRKNLLKTNDGNFYNWKEGDIFYTKIGEGKPILLIHDTDSKSSGEEWAKIRKKLAKNNTVYTIDLLGCGRSDKPAIKYTNYLYVQMISSFTKDIIKEKTNVIATNLSAPAVIMANNLDETLFDKIILINPTSIKELEAIPDSKAGLKEAIINLPVIGTFIYNKLMTPLKIDYIFRKKYYAKPQLISSKTEDIYYESAHLDGSTGKYLYASILTKYININMNHALKNINKTIYIIGSTDFYNNLEIINQYHNNNKNFEITHISNAALYPQMEIPEKTLSIINKILDK